MTCKSDGVKYLIEKLSQLCCWHLLRFRVLAQPEGARGLSHVQGGRVVVFWWIVHWLFGCINNRRLMIRPCHLTFSLIQSGSAIVFTLIHRWHSVFLFELNLRTIVCQLGLWIGGCNFIIISVRIDAAVIEFGAFAFHEKLLFGHHLGIASFLLVRRNHERWETSWRKLFRGFRDCVCELPYFSNRLPLL